MRGAPPVTIFAGRDAHRSLFAAAQYLGFGRNEIIPIDTDHEGRMIPAALAARLAAQPEPAIVCAAGGEINTGSFDPFEPIAAITRRHGSWLHLDLAFGAAAAVAPRLAYLTAGIELADSWPRRAQDAPVPRTRSGWRAHRHPEAHRSRSPARRLHHDQRHRPARAARRHGLGAGHGAARPRGARVGGAGHAGPRRPRRTRHPLPRERHAPGRGPGREPGPARQPRRLQPGADRHPADAHPATTPSRWSAPYSTRSSPTAPVCWAAPAGTESRCCAPRWRTTPRPRATST